MEAKKVPGAKVILARVNKPHMVGMCGVVKRYIKSRDEILVHLDNGQSYFAFAANVDLADDPMDDFNYVGSRHHY